MCENSKKIDWFNTKHFLQVFMDLFKCSYCYKEPCEPCNFGLCDHYFCRECALLLADQSKLCPDCGSSLWKEHLRVNMTVPEVLKVCAQIKNLVSTAETQSNILDSQIHGTDNLIEASSQVNEVTSQTDEAHILDEDNQTNAYVFDVPDKDVQETMLACCEDQSNEENNVNKGILYTLESKTTFPQNKRKCYHKIKETVKKKFVQDKTTGGETVSNCVTATRIEHTRSNEIHVPLNFLATQSKVVDDDMQTVCNSQAIVVSPPKSQFSTAVSDLDCENGVQRNSGYLYNRPKMTYSKRANKFANKNASSVFINAENDTKFPDDEDDKATNEKTFKCKSNVLSTHSNIELTDTSSKSAMRLKQKLKQSSTNKTYYKKKLTKRNVKGETLLHTASIKGQLEHVKELLQMGADPNTKDNAGWTPLHEACNHGSVEIVKLLLDHGAMMDMVAGDDNETPLHDAVSNNRLEVVQLLLQRGAPITLRNRHGYLPVDCVQSSEVKDAFADTMLIGSMIETTCNDPDISCSIGNKVITTTGLNKLQKAEVENCVIDGGKLLDNFELSVTHVVCGVDENLVSTRTMKYMIGVLTGKWMVSYQWLLDSKIKNQWVKEVDYEINGIVEGIDAVPRKARINKWKSLPKLFEGCSFYLSGNFGTPGKTQLSQLITYAGGKLLLREPKTSEIDPLIIPISPSVRKLNIVPNSCSPVVVYHAKEGSAQACCVAYILYDANKSPNHKKIFSPVLCTAPVAWFLDCISRFEICDVREAYNTTATTLSNP